MLLERWLSSREDQPKMLQTTQKPRATPEPIEREKCEPLSIEEEKSCQEMLKECEMFRSLSGNQIKTLANSMNVRSFKRNEIIVDQGSPVTSFYLVKDGEIHRDFIDPDSGRRHRVEFEIKAKSINTMSILGANLAHNTVKCNSNSCKIYEMPRQRLLNILINKEPEISVGIAESLSGHVRQVSKKYRTPLLEQKQQIIQSMPAVMIAAGIESYYRSALNAQVNRVLTGVKADLFPNMHIQVPMRVAYIAGFKGLRAYMDRYNELEEPVESIQNNGTSRTITVENETDTTNRNFWRRLGITIAPGVIMTPLSSVLEASNAGHMNKEPMTTRWMRGITARCGREILFGLGLNQMSDYFQERLHFDNRPMLSNMVGSLMGGVVSGYLSHVPHNMSTYKLLEPHRSYLDLYRNVFVERSVPPFLERYLARQGTGAAVDGGAATIVTYSNSQQAVRFMAATIFPRGLMVRTVQIVGSFIILNGTINYFTLLQQSQ
ncbi:unnamed protein product [Pseudo-nitzschia multistriata]|uniref:Cyclic nucleotide-binding domain-containing protein n=1 Tax=Pseudo-nitzschia multistriata TaxID=183589 RepID=A0A448ZNV8_9STRA|nr:unnamed protein product [Pseudo-nitzschia multistriata]